MIRRAHKWCQYRIQWWLFTRGELAASVNWARHNARLLAERDAWAAQFEQHAGRAAYHERSRDHAKWMVNQKTVQLEQLRKESR